MSDSTPWRPATVSPSCAAGVAAGWLVLLAAFMLLAPAAGRAAPGTEFQLPATTHPNSPMNTGIKVPKRGVTISCSGMIVYKTSPDTRRSGCEGIGGFDPAHSGAVDHHAVALIARVGNGRWKAIGRRGTISGPGTLKLAVNDAIRGCPGDCWGDNSGEWRVVVTGGNTVELSGRVVEHEDPNEGGEFPTGSFVLTPAEGETVLVEGRRGTFSDTTNRRGLWDVTVPKGNYTARVATPPAWPASSQSYALPAARNVNADEDREGLDFTVCWVKYFNSDGDDPGDYFLDAERAPCNLVEVTAAVVDIDGESYGDEAGVGGVGDVASTNERGLATLRVPNGSQVQASGGLDEGAVSRPATVRAKRGHAKVRLKLRPGMLAYYGTGRAYPDKVLVKAAGLPTRREEFELSVERTEPTAATFCTYRNSMLFKPPTTVDIRQGRYRRSAWVFVPPRKIGPWCAGTYTATLYAEDGRLVSDQFEIQP